MAKVKLDWFKLDCQLDSKFDLIEAEFGLKGFAVIVKLLQYIYGGEGYYCEWNDDIALVFARKNRASAGAVSEIVKRAIVREIFDKGLFEKYGILTSHGIQERYYEAVDRRKFAKIKPEYLLLCNTPKNENADISSKNVNISGENANISPTEKKRKEKNRIEENRQTAPPKDLSVVELSDEEREELVRLSDRLTVEKYISNLSLWQVKNRRRSKKAYALIKKFIEEDKAQKSLKTDHSYNLDEWEDFALRFDPTAPVKKEEQS